MNSFKWFYVLFMSTGCLVNASTFQVPCQYLGSYGAITGDRIVRDVCPQASSINALRMYYFVIDLEPGASDQVQTSVRPLASPSSIQPTPRELPTSLVHYQPAPASKSPDSVLGAAACQEPPHKPRSDSGLHRRGHLCPVRAPRIRRPHLSRLSPHPIRPGNPALRRHRRCLRRRGARNRALSRRPSGTVSAHARARVRTRVHACPSLCVHACVRGA
jgi:hypothetical protein